MNRPFESGFEATPGIFMVMYCHMTSQSGTCLSVTVFPVQLLVQGGKPTSPKPGLTLYFYASEKFSNVLHRAQNDIASNF